MSTFYVYANKFCSRVALFCSLFLFFVSASAGQYPSLLMHGEKYASACAQLERKGLKGQLFNKNIRNAEQAWRVFEVLLCGPDDNFSRNYIKSVISRNTRKKSGSTGDNPKSKMIPRSDELVRQIMAGGKAWDANIDADPDGVTLQYFANEACVKGVRLGEVNSRWAIVEVSEACD
jgi:hypothetical protein